MEDKINALFQDITAVFEKHGVEGGYVAMELDGGAVVECDFKMSTPRKLGLLTFVMTLLKEKVQLQARGHHMRLAAQAAERQGGLE